MKSLVRNGDVAMMYARLYGAGLSPAVTYPSWKEEYYSPSSPDSGCINIWIDEAKNFFTNVYTISVSMDSAVAVDSRKYTLLKYIETSEKTLRKHPNRRDLHLGIMKARKELKELGHV